VQAPPNPAGYATGNRRLDLVLCFREPGHNLSGWPEFVRTQEFWTDLGRRGGDEFRSALDYAGLDFFPDVFQPVPADRLPETVTAVLRLFRHQSLAAAGIDPSVPVHVTEHGWATGTERPYSRQSEVLETVVRTIDEHSEELNITTYEHFALRDADSGHDHPLFQLGILDSAYRPKPAATTYRDLIDEVSVKGW
jgi:hypothetical protein